MTTKQEKFEDSFVSGVIQASEPLQKIKQDSDRQSDTSIPKDKRLPLACVVFNQPTAIPGSPILYTSVVPGETRTASGAQYTCPAVFWDPTIDKIWIEGRLYPMERVHYFERTKMAKKVVPEVLPNYTIGKRA